MNNARIRLWLAAALCLVGLTLVPAFPLRGQENPMAAPSFPVEEDEPEAVTTPPPLPPSATQRFNLVTAPLPPVRPWSPSANGANGRPQPPFNAGDTQNREQGQPATAPVQPPVPAAPGVATPTPPVSANPVDAPVPPLRPGTVLPTEPVAEEPPAAPPPPPRDPVFSIEPDMRVAFAPLIATPSTTEEIEAEEEKAPEPTLVEKQTDAVDIACIKPEVMGLIRQAGEYFGGTPVITSGQRNRGRAGSFHRRCMAADFFVPGIERARLAKYLRSVVGAGGVGTYCHTKSVHIDIGEPRNWYQCGRRFRFAQR